ncbi:hypothetical protein C8J56DRAFT_1100477, partial [Mycena floridula]
DTEILFSDQLVQDRKPNCADVTLPPLALDSLPSSVKPYSLNDIVTGHSPAPPTSPNITRIIEIDKLSRGECHQILCNLCPACFGNNTYGRPFIQGGDIHIALDANQHHKHVAGAGESFIFHQSRHFLSKQCVDQVGDRIIQARWRPAKAYHVVVPDLAIDSCRDSFYAAKGDKQGK